MPEMSLQEKLTRFVAVHQSVTVEECAVHMQRTADEIRSLLKNLFSNGSLARDAHWSIRPGPRLWEHLDRYMARRIRQSVEEELDDGLDDEDDDASLKELDLAGYESPPDPSAPVRRYVDGRHVVSRADYQITIPKRMLRCSTLQEHPE